MNRHINWKIKRVKELPNNDEGDYFDGRLRVKIHQVPEIEMSLLLHEAIHAICDFYRERLNIPSEMEEVIALHLEEQFQNILEEVNK